MDKIKEWKRTIFIIKMFLNIPSAPKICAKKGWMTATKYNNTPTAEPARTKMK